MKLGDKEIDYDKNFKFYDHETAESSLFSRNIYSGNYQLFSEGGRLRSSTAWIVVQEEQPKLETQKSELVLRVAAGKN